MGVRGLRFDTRLVHSGQEPEPGSGDIVAPIHVATAYDRRNQDPLRYFYGRGENPTREALEQCLASLEDVPWALTFSSGQAAGAAVLSLLSPGDRLVCSDDVYGGTYSLLAHFGRYGIQVEYADLSDEDVVREVITEDIAMVWVETPTNPLLKVADIAGISGRGPLVVVDNTLASPALQQPIRCGADISLYSTTKFVAGHADVLGGALVMRDEAVYRRLLEQRTTIGNVPGALDCFLVHRGVKTLSLRVARQVANAGAITAALLDHPAVGRVRYPGLAGDPGHEVARRQMSAPGSIISFEYLGVVGKLLERVRLLTPAVSLGGVRSLIECPALMTHRPIPQETRLALGITDNLVRLSAGIEDPADLVEDLVTALTDAA